MALTQLAAQASAGTLPAQQKWAGVQAVIEASTVAVRAGTLLQLFRQFERQWWQATLDAGLVVNNFVPVDESALDAAQRLGTVLKDLR
ncbi:Uncharacterised protein [Serratia ficaria]|uniref:hypothetical protein n=1 Tax=Serratia ficaria TaxID=61651 RepID=UPI0021841F4B|nr:hypothetical protein [Serratia ficaria]CAI2538622.1 Uncharacterised protein [Serratia ficaria]